MSEENVAQEVAPNSQDPILLRAAVADQQPLIIMSFRKDILIKESQLSGNEEDDNFLSVVLTDDQLPLLLSGLVNTMDQATQKAKELAKMMEKMTSTTEESSDQPVELSLKDIEKSVE